ncbi:MAG: CBS domain-containing protein [Planctomycetes bacterium]|nr:CBS domain-containing protein [Planctomycetota bacterium]
MKLPVCARDVMTHSVRTLSVETSVRDAATFLLRHHISGAPVLDRQGRPVGVFTLRDIAVHVQNGILELPVIDPRVERVKGTGEFIPSRRGFHFEGLEETNVVEFMTPRVIWVRPDAPLGFVARKMAALRIHRVFVMEERRIVGVITSLDIVRWLEEHLAESRLRRKRKAI